MVDVGGLVVRDVDAMVQPDEALSENLLGLSFLSKLKRYEYANGRMVLEQQFGRPQSESGLGRRSFSRRHLTSIAELPPRTEPAHRHAGYLERFPPDVGHWAYPACRK